MEVKAKITATISYEMVLNENYWPEAKSEDEMIKLQQAYLEDDPVSLLEAGTISDIKVERSQ
jgi:hypothetical protein